MSYSAVPPAAPQTPPPSGATGLGGWLVLVQISLYASLLRLSGQINTYSIPALGRDVRDELFSRESGLYHVLWMPTLIYELVVSVLMVVLVVFCLVALYTRKRLFPLLMILLYSVNLAVALFDFVLMQTIEATSDLVLEDAGSLRDLVRAALTTAIWVPYFIASGRVRRTFVR